ncbi:alkene reductase [Umezawaea tangerina]|uniref:N-ethylmaleimide reductase n=1 Tax=Umezawaea tangerina TaxID=84725 RepID=A0A2T0T702_9PSEU|nr:alkene reductase [Umezawaea tangerina]PRY41427.1 N-ethylmaleimide reductase [Umezawaea tangerina]
MSTPASSFSRPAQVGAVNLANRLVMSPMTRNRSTPEGVPTALNAEYYGQRASMGLIISEGTQISADGQGYLLTPGIYTDEHVAGWRQVTDAVHRGGGKIFIQLMHAGRVSHPSNTPHGRQPVAPSPIRPDAEMPTATGRLPIPEPRGLSTDEVASTVQDFRVAAAAAIRAGADGVEIHGGYGYLVQQFLSGSANRRTDGYGGSVDNRVRFAVEVATAVAEEIGADRTGIRITPGIPQNGIVEDDVDELYPALVRALEPLGLAYLEVVQRGDDDKLLRVIREAWSSTLVVNRAGADLATRVADLDSGLADLVTVASLALANPDLVERLTAGAALNDADPATFFGGDSRGYTDYPTLGQ